jgi:hypothetical protein
LICDKIGGGGLLFFAEKIEEEQEIEERGVAR